MARSTVFIIGAGVAGLACGRVLREAGIDVRLADKGRGPGGRCSTRRSDAGRFDHATPYFTVQDPRFQAQVEAWLDAGVVKEWAGRFHLRNELADGPLYLGAPAMNAFVRHEAEALEAEFGLQMGPPVRNGLGHDLYRADGEPIGAADFVVMATPAPQAAGLLPEGSALHERAAHAEMLPCWTLMAAFEEGAVAPQHDLEELADGPIEKVIWQGGRPDREPGLRLVAHATPDWAQQHLEDEADAVAAAMEKALGLNARPVFRTAHRWRYARAIRNDGPSFGLDLDRGLATCGDWHLGPNVEDAWLSGHELGQQLVTVLKSSFRVQ